MQVSIFSFMMCILWFSIYIIIINKIRKKNNFIMSFSIFPLLFLSTLSILRLIINYEYPYATIIHSKTIMNPLYTFLRAELAFGLQVMGFLLIIWISGSVILLMRTIIFEYKYRKYLSLISRYETDAEVRILEELLVQNEMNGSISLVKSDFIDNPMLFGLIKPTIYIPNIEFSDSELRYIISHELTHCKNRDILKKYFIHVMKIVFWWNPFMHLFARDFSQILEVDCDLSTVRNYDAEDKANYLRTISKVVEFSIRNGVTAKHIPAASYFSMSNDASELKQRYRLVLHFKEDRVRYRFFNILICIIGLVSFIASYFVVIQPHYSPPEGIYLEKSGPVNLILRDGNGNYSIIKEGRIIKTIDDIDVIKADSELSQLEIYDSYSN